MQVLVSDSSQLADNIHHRIRVHLRGAYMIWYQIISFMYDDSVKNAIVGYSQQLCNASERLYKSLTEINIAISPIVEEDFSSQIEAEKVATVQPTTSNPQQVASFRWGRAPNTKK